MRLKATTPLDTAIKRMSDGHQGAATIIGHILKEYPSRIMDWMRLMDKKELYGLKIWTMYLDCSMDMKEFLDRLTGTDVEKG